MNGYVQIQIQIIIIFFVVRHGKEDTTASVLEIHLEMYQLILQLVIVNIHIVGIMVDQNVQDHFFIVAVKILIK